MACPHFRTSAVIRRVAENPVQPSAVEKILAHVREILWFPGKAVFPFTRPRIPVSQRQASYGADTPGIWLVESGQFQRGNRGYRRRQDNFNTVFAQPDRSRAGGGADIEYPSFLWGVAALDTSCFQH